MGGGRVGGLQGATHNAVGQIVCSSGQRSCLCDPNAQHERKPLFQKITSRVTFAQNQENIGQSTTYAELQPGLRHPRYLWMSVVKALPGFT